MFGYKKYEAMKRISFMIIAGAIALLGSCQKNEEPLLPNEVIIDEKEPGKGITTITAYHHNEADTKVSLTDGGSIGITSVAFKAGDVLQLLRVSSNENITGFAAAALPYTIASGVGTQTGIFNANSTGINTTGIWVAIHPGLNSALAVTTGATGYFTIDLPDVQTAASPSAIFSNAENYMCFYGPPIEVVDLTMVNPVSFSLMPLTSVMRFHVEDTGGFTTGRLLTGIRVLSSGADYFGTKVSFLPKGIYHSSAPIGNRVNTYTKKLDLSGLPLGGMSVGSSLTQAGCLALYCEQSVYNDVLGYEYVLEFDNGSLFVIPKPKLMPLLSGRVYEVALTIDGALTTCVPPIGVNVTHSALTGPSGTPVSMSASVIPTSANLFSPTFQWEREVSPGTWQAISGATSTVFNTAVMATGNTFRVAVTGCSATAYSDPITINGNPGAVIATSTQLTNSFAGAFWRDQQRGERIVRIRLTGAANIGPWSAAVVWYDPKWTPLSNDGILLDQNHLGTASLAARGITWNALTEAPNTPVNNPENFLVTSGLPIITGVAAEGDSIQFRIGLQQSFGAYNANTNPARYAMVLISYGTPVKAHKIFIRQGQGDDYVMLPTDNARGIDAMKFSPFNLTKATPMNAPVSPMGSTSHADPPAIFVDYPSQAGAFFQWENSGSRLRYAWDASTISMTSPTWSAEYGIKLWTGNTPPIALTNESCPVGYRRPNDGSTTALNTTGAVLGSEMRQSLFSTPPASTTSNIANSVWGWYADGFFDRRAIVNGQGTSPGAQSTVSVGKEEIAHVGRIYFNPTTQASLFFPAAGFRLNTTGALNRSGGLGRYLSSSLAAIDYHWSLTNEPLGASLTYNTIFKSTAVSVRCVRDECKPLTSITVTRSGSGDVTIGTAVTLSATPIPTNAFLMSFQWEMEAGGGLWQTILDANTSSYVHFASTSGNNTFRVRVTDCSGVSTVSPNITINCLPMVTPPTTGTQIAESYAGAFWRWNQKGERIIRIRINTLTDAGDWGAVAAWHDGQWNPASGDGVILDKNNLGTASLAARGITWNSGTENPGSFDPESYPVSGSAPFVSGTAALGDTIQFRIGLQQNFGAYNANTNPARYAVILLSYGTPIKTHRIYVRQGEGDDYVMRPTDGTRGPDAMKFSAFNITKAAPMNAPVSPMGSTTHADPPAIFVDYPSQAGALFQWENSSNTPDNRTLYAWDAATPGVPPAGWLNSYSQVHYWTGATPPFGSFHESCPAGYRRPNDGNTISNSAAPPIAGSEIRQSLYSNPATSTTSRLENSVWGYYADGFFDRRAIVNALAYSGPGANSAVSVGNDNVAYMGRLYFNPTTQSSIFLPAAGSRFTLGLYLSGSTGRYLTSSSFTIDNPWHLGFTASTSQQLYSGISRSYGNSVRCVKDECKAITSIAITRTGSGDLPVGSAVTLTGMPTPASSFITAIQWQIETSPGVWQNIIGATNYTNTIVILTPGSNNYRVLMTDCGGVITSPELSINGIAMVTPPITGDQITVGYAGAFWRNNEKGERIIRIPITNIANAGSWTAIAAWYDSQWVPTSNDGIIFDTNNLGTSSLAARGITWNASTESPGSFNTESYTVSGNSFYVTGNVALNDTIKFRIGLQQTFGAYNANTNPARYALVLLSYGTPAKVHRIYIRQGEGDDYLMRTTDGFNSAGLNIPNGPGARVAAAKFSPFNLTMAPPMNNPVSINGATGGSEPPAIFTTFPSQAGAFFQWANIGTRIRYAWDANSTGAHSPSWNYNTGNYSPDYWTSTTPPLSDTQEVCPIGYHRPNDGATHTNVSNSIGADVLNSEMRMSLFSSPQLAATSNLVNSVWGWYADGYFDRRAIVASANGTATSVVSVAANDIAYVGRLFFNPSPSSQASIFFPAAGYLAYTTGILSVSGSTGRYFSSSCFDTLQPWSLNLTSTASGVAYSGTTYRKDVGFSIRCVKD